MLGTNAEFMFPSLKCSGFTDLHLLLDRWFNSSKFLFCFEFFLFKSKNNVTCEVCARKKTFSTFSNVEPHYLLKSMFKLCTVEIFCTAVLPMILTVWAVQELCCNVGSFSLERKDWLMFRGQRKYLDLQKMHLI